MKSAISIDSAGRGACSNLPGRFELRSIEPFEDHDPSRPVTRVVAERSRSILSRNDSPDVPFDISINPYKGCEHGCIYCFARPTHAYLDLSPGLDFETRIFSKPDAPRLLRAELARPGYRCQPLALGANTDPYQPVERRLGLTRSILEILADSCHPVSVVTKSHLVLRDLDLLEPMARRRQAAVFVSITTLDRGLARKMEPRAPTPARRLDAIRELSRAGVPVGVLASPMIPGLNDHELERILDAAAGAGALTAGYILVRLPHEVRPLFEDWLARHYPALKGKVLGRIRKMRSGRMNDPKFGSRMRGQGPVADLLDQRFELARRRLGLDPRRIDLDSDAFRPPRAQGRLF